MSTQLGYRDMTPDAMFFSLFGSVEAEGDVILHNRRPPPCERSPAISLRLFIMYGLIYRCACCSEKKSAKPDLNLRRQRLARTKITGRNIPAKFTTSKKMVSLASFVTFALTRFKARWYTVPVHSSTVDGFQSQTVRSHAFIA